MSEWKYNGLNRSGQPKYKRYTKQTTEQVSAYLTEQDIEHQVNPKMLNMFYIWRPKDKTHRPIVYYSTTGRWGHFGGTFYQSKGIEDFVERFYYT